MLDTSSDLKFTMLLFSITMIVWKWSISYAKERLNTILAWWIFLIDRLSSIHVLDEQWCFVISLSACGDLYTTLLDSINFFSTEWQSHGLPSKCGFFDGFLHHCRDMQVKILYDQFILFSWLKHRRWPFFVFLMLILQILVSLCNPFFVSLDFGLSVPSSHCNHNDFPWC